jgi:hypothetical protein
MAKKLIAGKTKLTAAIVPGKKESINQKELEPLNLIPPKKEVILPRSFRLKQSDLERLKNITREVNDVSPSHFFSETNIIRSLIYLGSKIKPDRILNAFRDIL